MRPRAYLGLAEAFLPERVVRICMSCDDRTEAEAIAAGEGMECTHGLCADCASKVFAEIAAIKAESSVVGYLNTK